MSHHVYIVCLLFLGTTIGLGACRIGKVQRKVYRYEQTFNYGEIVGSVARPHEFPEPNVWALYPGGLTGLNDFIQREMVYPKAAIKDSVEGIVKVRFVVEANGQILRAEVLESSNEVFNREAIRLIMASGPWVPAAINRKPVRSLYILPVYFRLT